MILYPFVAMQHALITDPFKHSQYFLFFLCYTSSSLQHPQCCVRMTGYDDMIILLHGTVLRLQDNTRSCLCSTDERFDLSRKMELLTSVAQTSSVEYVRRTRKSQIAENAVQSKKRKPRRENRMPKKDA